MRYVSAVMLALGLLIGACGGDSEPSNAERPDDTTAEVIPETTVPTPTAVPVVVEPEELTYTVQAGDLLGSIAQTFGLSLDELLAGNPDIEDPNAIQIGDVILIPDAPQSAETSAPGVEATPTAAPAADGVLPED